MFSFIKKRFLHRFILVYHDEIEVSVHIYDIKNQKILQQVSENFVLESKEEFTDEIVSYINNKQEEVTRSYIVTLVTSEGQGIVPTCSTSEYKKYSVDKRYIYNICVDGLFANYVTKIDINWIKKIFKKTGIDLIFSPFTLLKDIIEDDIVEEKTTLYILYIEHSATLIVKKDEKYIYGSFFDTNSSENPLYSDYEEDSDDEFEIEDDFDFEDEDFEEDLVESEYEKEVSLVEENRTFTRFLSSSLKEFYSNEIYQGSFIDKIKIYSEDDIDKSIIEYIENELFINCEFNFIELDPIVLKYAQREVIGV